MTTKFITIDHRLFDAKMKKLQQAAKGSAALEKYSNNVVQSAKANAPVLTGKLRESIIATKTETSSVAFSVEVDYASFVHDGTSKMSDNPFLLNAILENESLLLNAYKNEVKDSVK